MDLVSEWAIKIAREVAPNEIDQAPFIALDFAEGGRARRNLFRRRKGGEVGGSGLTDFVNFFPIILQSIAVAAPVIYGVLTTAGALNDTIDLVKTLKGFHESWQQSHKQSAKASPTSKTQPETTQPIQEAKQPDQTVIDNSQMQQLKSGVDQSVISMAQTMHSAGMDRQKSTQKGYIIMTLLLEDLESAKQVLDKLTENN